jgi:DNA-binding MarR family transcriptional regulator
MATDQHQADSVRTAPAADLTAEVVIDLFRRAGRALRASDLDAPGEWAASLTMPQIRILYLLGRQGPLPVGSVAEAMRVSQPSATETIDRLVRAGYVSRTTCTADRRVVRIALTDGGRSFIDRPWDARRLLLTELLANASDADRQHVTTGLETLCRLLDGAPQPARPNEKIAEDGT